MELLVVHLLTHEIPILLVGLMSLIFGKRAVLKYVRSRDPAVQELRAAALDAHGWIDYPSETRVRLMDAINAIDCKKECGH